MDDTQQVIDIAAFRSAIAERYRFHVETFEKGDARALVHGFFAEDAVWTGRGFPDAVGHAQLTAMFEQVVGRQTVSIMSEYSAVSGNIGWDIATYPVVPHDQTQAPFTFRPLFVWVRGASGWRVAAVCSFLR